MTTEITRLNNEKLTIKNSSSVVIHCYEDSHITATVGENSKLLPQGVPSYFTNEEIQLEGSGRIRIYKDGIYDFNK